MIELVACLGVILVLIGLALPAIGRATEASRASKMQVVIRSDFMAVTAYAQDHADEFPSYGHTPSNASNGWWRPLVESGILANEQSSDPDGFRRFGIGRVHMAMCLVARPEELMPEHVRPIDLVPCAPVRMSEVAYPDAKGALVQGVHIRGAEHIFWTWNPWNPPSSPIAWIDGAVSVAKCTDFEIQPAYLEEWVGHPVLSTWEGCRGIDRRR